MNKSNNSKGLEIISYEGMAGIVYLFHGLLLDYREQALFLSISTSKSAY